MSKAQPATPAYDPHIVIRHSPKSGEFRSSNYRSLEEAEAAVAKLHTYALDTAIIPLAKLFESGSSSVRVERYERPEEKPAV